MSDKQLTFYAQAAILDEYIHSSDPSADKDSLEVILMVLRTKKDLHDYFFISQPNAAWADILWNNGFFAKPPSRQKEGENYILPRWYEQDFLISVADQVPEIALKHVQNVEGEGFYISKAIAAVCRIDSEKAEEAVPKIIAWLENTKIAIEIAAEAYELCMYLGTDGKVTSAFDLFRALISPLPAPDTGEHKGFQNNDAFSKLPAWPENMLSKGIDLFLTLNCQQTVSILEKSLCKAIKLESETRKSAEYENSSWWRVAIEDTEQDISTSYKDRLLIELRKAVEVWVQKDLKDATQLLRRYLSDGREILRRLGLYILHRYPQHFNDEVKFELLKKENLDNSGIHHEFFVLLQKGYPYLTQVEQESLIKFICDGPPKERLEELTKWAQENRSIESSEYLTQYPKFWIRDRLWMLKNNLSGSARKVLDDVIAEIGEPEHPDFARWSSGVYTVHDVSPITEDELAKMPAGKLVDLVSNWKPDDSNILGPRRISYEGFGGAIANVILNNPQKYKDLIPAFALHRAEYALAILIKIEKQQVQTSEVWTLMVNLSETLLGNEYVRNDMDGKASGQWRWVRQRMASLLENSLSKGGTIPTELLTRIKNVLLLLIDDPDPDFQDDQPKDGFLGHNDPATVAINHVRPLALSALINYSLYVIPEKSKREDKPGSSSLARDIQEVLSKKVDTQIEPSLSVHSVYGQHLWCLFWLDKEWVESHIDRIFPPGNDEDSIHFFVAAWDSFVMFNHFNMNLVEILYTKYVQAIENVSKGYISKTHLQPIESLSNHLIWEYLLSEKDLYSSGKRPLITKFFEIAKPEDRGTACWLLWRFLSNDPSKMKSYWPKVRSLWEWRMQAASQANNSSDFEKEMEWFAHMPLTVRPIENITSLWPLLEGLLPYITRKAYGGDWSAIEEYLASEVDRDPEKSIHLYYLMHTHGRRRSFSYHEDKARKILETAAACPASRKKALDLIDLLGRTQNYQYRDIYDRFSGT